MKKLLFISLLLPFLFFSQSNIEFDFYDDCGDENFGKPNRTYGGNNWYGGFSDHLPIYCRFEASTDIFTMFYNVENLFDTIDDPRRNDNSFLPNSKKKWNTERYFNKLEKLERVFSTINSDKMPNLIGLCEIENQQVIDDLLKQPFFSNHTFNIIHQESPDNRGIDCAILYDKEFSLIESEFITIKIPGSDKPTRDIVLAKFEINNEILNVFVNHWPSRWGGKNETEHKRVYAANILKKYIEDNISKKENILIMGDFNDYPSDTSINDYLMKVKNFNLVNLMSELNCGSYNYKGKWGWLDQIIISSNLIEKRNFIVKDYGAFIKEWMLYKPKK